MKRALRGPLIRTRIATCTVLLCVASSLSTAIVIDASPLAGQAPLTTEQTKSDRSWYLRWLDEDAVYIIAPEERAAFLRLDTDEERNKFIEQFWLRRDPTPGTAANEFKEEHYRRISYANERFASSVPGWKSDRGRIYIMYGPPDQIESHPQHAVPFEQWFYNHIEGVGDRIVIEFEDRTGTGDYKLTLDPKKGVRID